MSIPIDRLVRSHRKTIAIVIERDGRLTVRAPLHLSGPSIQAFVESHAEWIAKNPPAPVSTSIQAKLLRWSEHLIRVMKVKEKVSGCFRSKQAAVMCRQI
jgi:predicted metal-dependent hydrolase